MIKGTMTVLVLGLLAAQSGIQSRDIKNLSLKQRLHNGETLKNVRVPTDADREKVHAIIQEKKPELLATFSFHQDIAIRKVAMQDPTPCTPSEIVGHVPEDWN